MWVYTETLLNSLAPKKLAKKPIFCNVLAIKDLLFSLTTGLCSHTEMKARRQVDLLLGQGDMLRLTSSLDGLHETQRLDNQHLEYEQFFDHNVDIKDQISSNNDDSTKQPQRDMLQVMSEHKSLIHKVNNHFFTFD